ncbi:MAG: nitronate monooxygenase family protein [Bacteroidota bacterium]
MALPRRLSQTLSLPVVAAPMFLVSGPRIVLESCKNGIIGTFPALNQRSTEGFEQWVIEIKQDLAKWERETGKTAPPYGVNLIVHRSNPRLYQDLEICVKHEVPLIITSLGAATKVIEAIHGYGGMVYHDIISRRHAQKAADAGVDGIIAVASGAGGHAGTTNPFALIAEIRKFFDKTLLLAGCMNSGSDVAAAISMGADLAYLGTRFINTFESRADAAYQRMIIDSGAKDIVYTPAVSGVHANFMKASLEEAGFDMEQLDKAGKMNYGEKLTPAKEEAKAWKTVWSAGQGVAGIEDVVPVSDLVSRIKQEFAESIHRQQQYLDWLDPSSPSE